MARQCGAAQEIIGRCTCCGTVLVSESDATKFFCAQCQTTCLCTDFDSTQPPSVHPVSSARVDHMAATCLRGERAKSAHELHVKLKPLLDYLMAAFSSMACLNSSFKIKPRSRRAHYSCSNVDFADVRRTFGILLLLPSKKPLYCALTGARNCLRRLPISLCDDARNLHWAMVLLEIPILHKALNNWDSAGNTVPKSMAEVPEIQALCYEIVKRVLGVLSQAESRVSGNYLASWFLKLSRDDFSKKVDLINLYITFQLKRYLFLANNLDVMRRGSLGAQEAAAPQLQRHTSCNSHMALDDEYFHLSQLKEEMGQAPDEAPGWSRGAPALPRKSAGKKKQDLKIRFHQYTSNYHLRTASGALGLFVKANYIRLSDDRLPVNAFYNSLVDFVNVKLDFDSWLSKKKTVKQLSKTEPALQTVIDYIHGTSENYLLVYERPQCSLFYMCQYPFLISLGGKISILEYEARRQMERKAEEAFINSLDKRIALDVYFKVRVRRDHIVQDSLMCIELNQNNLKKSLRVQFINEPGVDAGGLKKEWFLLLTRALFSSRTGMLHNVEQSNLLWFNVIPMRDLEIYYLFGAVLGLAIYNSTILDLNFPLGLYKILLDLPVGLADYKDLYPEAARNLFKLREYTADELDAVNLVFDVTFLDVYGKYHHRNLIENGSNVAVTVHNREMYIDKYARFFLVEGIEAQLRALKNGFSSVVDGNAFSLFLPDEIQLLLCGSEQKSFDVDILKSVTKYSGWGRKEDAENSLTVKWFWEYMSGLTFQQQKQLLLFVTGSDRVPATGIQNLSLRISRLSNGRDSDRLPTAHTCFNELAIYEYSSREKMIDKLSKAIYMLAGFGIQ
ncbi:hypothetical protein METBIDRAFT_77994 [Metschnikowia bicuspidata var. bicuspidata NRRL YB-4993]|uniref:HECT-type E3 ubiquitin transferase n=1 Tax=Metschnikowia bicuspidata var. bicuspidata NRRL YB-4993 TaxID=869754 RepID=A0A1A0HAE7_9ASCO|nr:hypothetical protein METBIDRAFT_77994 [Metschnikowia bicuspidata var. bicuspidata NRRL YB-4993]OBA20848.1 hypothetical protein METBIDRAFT_77994 [Metschnikowia bicuspidata var. bicuspidata NRRL YB-4993]